MSKNTAPKTSKSAPFLKDVEFLCAVPTPKKFPKLLLAEYPFDLQLLNSSRLYQQSRADYLKLGGVFSARLTSMMRGLSAQDLFKNEIEYTPSFSEIKWFSQHADEVSDPEAQIEALSHFNEIALFHEQNHRIVWTLLPPAPTEERDLCRYLNFAEALVVMIDLALGDELGKKLSFAMERQSVIYRTGGEDSWHKKGKEIYRRYLLAAMCATYYIMELTHPDDILAAVNYVLPGQKKMNQQAVQRSFDINELFPRVTNPQWQERYWKEASQKLGKLHAKSPGDALYLPEDPLDLEEEFVIARSVLNHFGL